MAILKKRWFLSLLGVLALAFLVWFAGPYLAFAGFEPLASELVRLIVILVLVAAWGLNNLRVQAKEKRATDKLIEGIAGGGEAEQAAEDGQLEQAEEMAALRERFDEAMGVLKGSRDKAAKNLYALPWYIIIGPPGCGKTTALLNSGLDFPLADRFGKDGLQGVGGTRNCDWWFTNEAVLLDTAGRYVTQDSHQAIDSAGWASFLSLLRKYRRRRPINGVLVAISLSDLMLMPEHERGGHVRAIKERIHELHEQLRIRFPVYVLFTKADLVAGFMEFFDDLGREQRAQVWGFTFPLDKDQEGVIQRFGVEFDALLTRLNERLLWRLSQERDSERRRLIFAFPQQFGGLKDVLEQFLTEIFRPTRFQQTPLLRGVYFTSGTQEGTPIDRLMASVAKSFGVGYQALSAFTGPGRSYFITDPLNKVVFQEAALAGVERKFERQRAWLQRIAYAGALGAVILGAVAWTTSYTRNQRYLSDVQSELDAYNRTLVTPLEAGADLEEILPRLDASRALLETSDLAEKGVPMTVRFGLYQGDKLGGAAREGYRRELNNLLLPVIGSRIQRLLLRNTGNSELQFELLKAYLMLGDRNRLDPQFLTELVHLDWQRLYGSDPKLRGRLETHLDALLAGKVEPLSLNPQLIADVRHQLTREPLASFLYSRLKRDVAASQKLQLRLSELIGPDGERVYVRLSGEGLDAVIPGLFTYRGFYEVFLKESTRLAARFRNESWVLGLQDSELSRAELEQLEAGMRQLYIAEYIRVWDEVLKDFAIAPFAGLEHATRVLEILSSPTSPMRSLLQSVERNTNLGSLPAGMAKAAGQVSEEKSRLAGLLGAGAEAIGTPDLPGAPVAKHFARINNLLKSEDGAPPPLDRVVRLLSEFYAMLNAMSAGSGSEMMRAASQTSADDIRQRIRTEAAQQPEPVKTWLLQVASYGHKVTLKSARAQLNAKWRAQVLPACRRAIEKRYPFDRSARREVTLIDFGRFFGPGGLLDGFFEENLKDFVDTSALPWKWHSDELGISVSVLQQFQRGALIKETFFHGGGQQPSVRFGLSPLSLDADASQILLDIDGQKITYRHGPVRVTNVEWPGPDGPGNVRVVFQGDKGSQTLSEDGPWAWFRMLDQARIEPESADRFSVTFSAADYRAKYEIRASSVVNPFVMKELEQFRCPEGL